MKSEFFLCEDGLVVVDFFNVEGLVLHVDNEFLVGVDFVLFEWTHSDDDFDAVAFSGHFRIWFYFLMKSVF